MFNKYQQLKVILYMEDIINTVYLNMKYRFEFQLQDGRYEKVKI